MSIREKLRTFELERRQFGHDRLVELFAAATRAFEFRRAFGEFRARFGLGRQPGEGGSVGRQRLMSAANFMPQRR